MIAIMIVMTATTKNAVIVEVSPATQRGFFVKV